MRLLTTDLRFNSTICAKIVAFISFVPGVWTNASASDELLHCNYVNSYSKTGCELIQEKLAENEPYDTTFNIKYSYNNCEKYERIDIGVRTDRETALFLGGDANHVLTVNGKSLEVFSSTKARLIYVAIFHPTCTLQILEVTKTPSDSTLDQWKKEAELQAKVIRGRISAYQLAKFIEEINTWDSTQRQTIRKSLLEIVDSKLGIAGLALTDVTTTSGTFKNREDMPEAWNDLMAVDGDTLQFVGLLDFIDSIDSGRPSSLTAEEMLETSTSVKNKTLLFFKAKLKSEVKVGQGMIDRGSQIRAKINENLRRAISEATSEL